LAETASSGQPPETLLIYPMTLELKKYKAVFLGAADRFSECCRASDKRSFSQRIRRLIEYCRKGIFPDIILGSIEKHLT
jgi:hypothetical protein